MANFFASYPPSGTGGGVPTYADLAAFPSAVSAGDGALGIALDTNILYESNGTIWQPIASPGAALSIGTFDSGTPSADGAHIDGNALIMQSASATNPGLVNTTTQTLAGVKTFSSAPNLSSLTASLPLQLDGSKNVTAAAVALGGAQVSGTLPVARGGLGITSGTSGGILGFTASGTIASSTALAVSQVVIGGGAGATPTTLAAGSSGNVLTITGGIPTWAPPATSGTVTSVGMTVPAFLSVAGSPVTSSGTLAVTYSGTALPILNGGTGQTTAAAAFGALSPLTTKGDILGFDTANNRIPIGADGRVLTADSAQALGLKWAVPTTGTVTSVAMTVPTFLSVSGSPVTTTGTLAVTLSGTALPAANGGTGVVSTATFPTSGVVVTEAAVETLTNKDISSGTNTYRSIAQSTSGVDASSGQRLGTNTNDNASSGNIGEYSIQSRLRSAATSISNNTVTNVTSTPLALAAGDWDIDADIGFILSAATVTQWDAAITVTSATLPNADTIAVPNTAGEMWNQDGATRTTTLSVDRVLSVSHHRVSLSTSGTFYLVARIAFLAGTATVYGSIRARRPR